MYQARPRRVLLDVPPVGTDSRGQQTKTSVSSPLRPSIAGPAGPELILKGPSMMIRRSVLASSMVAAWSFALVVFSTSARVRAADVVPTLAEIRQTHRNIHDELRPVFVKW